MGEADEGPSLLSSNWTRCRFMVEDATDHAEGAERVT